MTFYVIDIAYMGPGSDQPPWSDYDSTVITTEKPEKLIGWLGTEEHICRRALGGFETLEAARLRISGEIGAVRKVDNDPDEKGVVETYKVDPETA